jgi:hypothetical protein
MVCPPLKGLPLTAVNLLEAILASKAIEPVEPEKTNKGGAHDNDLEGEILATCEPIEPKKSGQRRA